MLLGLGCWGWMVGWGIEMKSESEIEIDGGTFLYSEHMSF